MPVRQVLRFPHPALKLTAQVLRSPAEARRVGTDLVDTMRSFPGCVGLAATQLDEMARMVVVDVSEHPRAQSSHGLLVLANPRLAHREGGEVAREGCLSIPELTANVRRATRVVVEALTPELDPIEVDAEGFEARCLQHELDHLDGLLFLDRVDSLARDVFRRKTYR